jgi:hypothetical protein
MHTEKWISLPSSFSRIQLNKKSSRVIYVQPGAPSDLACRCAMIKINVSSLLILLNYSNICNVRYNHSFYYYLFTYKEIKKTISISINFHDTLYFLYLWLAANRCFRSCLHFNFDWYTGKKLEFCVTNFFCGNPHELN